MKFHVQVPVDVTRELEEIETWYDEQQFGLGEDFLREAFRCFRFLEKRPEAFSFKAGAIREMPLERFPYVIAYQVIDDVVLVLSIGHFKRETKRKRDE